MASESVLMSALVTALIPKKVELLIRFFEPFGRSRVFHFSLRTFAEVGGHPGPNETMQNNLIQFLRIF